MTIEVLPKKVGSAVKSTAGHGSFLHQKKSRNHNIISFEGMDASSKLGYCSLFSQLSLSSSAALLGKVAYITLGMAVWGRLAWGLADCRLFLAPATGATGAEATLTDSSSSVSRISIIPPQVRSLEGAAGIFRLPEYLPVL